MKSELQIVLEEDEPKDFKNKEKSLTHFPTPVPKKTPTSLHFITVLTNLVPVYCPLDFIFRDVLE